jgi:glycosyltransferase involved in cell wall biosynthesis
MRVGLLHYLGPPTVGGVEDTLRRHALGLAELGHEPILVVGQGEPFHRDVPVVTIPEMSSRNPRVLEVQSALHAGTLGGAFEELRADLTRQIRTALASREVVVAHNVLTLHKNLALTAALWDLQEASELPPLVGWHHDLAWARAGYRSQLHPGFPWDLLRRPWPGVLHVTVSRGQRTRLAELYGVEPGTIRVVPPGVDPETILSTPQARLLARRLRLLEADGVLLLPARITRRKNIELALHVLAALRHRSGKDYRLVVTGPPGPHNPANLAYWEELRGLRTSLQLESSAHFLYELAEDGRSVAAPVMVDLYRAADALLFPSHDEGFGIPVLEAGLARLPVFCADLAPLRESGGEQAAYFSPDAPPEEVAALIESRLADDPAHLLRRRVMREYRWEARIRDQVVPILEEAVRA